MAKETDFAAEVKKVLNEYKADVFTTLKDTQKEVAKEAVKKLKATSPKRTGTYKRKWRTKTFEKRLEANAYVYVAAPQYRLTHVLEHGHAKRGGGRVAPIVHIKPVEEWANNEVVKRLEDRLG